MLRKVGEVRHSSTRRVGARERAANPPTRPLDAHASVTMWRDDGTRPTGASRRAARAGFGGAGARGGANNDEGAGGSRSRARERRWASDARSASLGQSLVANAIITTVVFLALHHLRALVRLALVATLAALYLNNPARDARTHASCWESLLAERRRRQGERNAEDLSRFDVVRFLKNAVGDAAGLMQGQRVMVDFVFFAMAYVDSEAAVDAEFFALGAMGTWNVVPMAPLRSAAAAVAATLEDLSRAASEGGEG